LSWCILLSSGAPARCSRAHTFVIACCSRIAVFRPPLELTRSCVVLHDPGPEYVSIDSDSVFKDRSAECPLKGSANVSPNGVPVKPTMEPFFPPNPLEEP